MIKPIPVEDAPDVTVQIITARDPLHPRAKLDTWPLAAIKGGVDKMTVETKGNTTIIKIESRDGGGSFLDPDGWEREPKRRQPSKHPRTRSTPEVS